MSKLFTIVHPTYVSNTGDTAYVHVLGNDGFSKLSKCTTAKRGMGIDSLVNFSYVVDGDLPAAGGKVYTIQHKAEVAEGTIYLPIRPHNGYLTRKAATKAKRALEQDGYTNLCILSFIVDADDAQPVEQDYSVTVTVRARSQDEANAIAMAAVYGGVAA